MQKTPVMHTHSSRMALEYLLTNRAIGYLPSPVVAQSVEEGILHPVPDAPVMDQSLYLVWRDDSDKQEWLEVMLAVPFTQVIESV